VRELFGDELLQSEIVDLNQTASLEVMHAPSLRCGECHRGMTKAQKAHRGRKYCMTCYARMFKRRLCSGCGNFSRLPIFDASAVCRSCETQKPCVRCSRSGRKIGKLTPDGPACASCSHYFREAESCEHCSTASTRLVRQEIGGKLLRCCPTCISKQTMTTCSSCRLPRVAVNAEGPPLCKRCFASDDVPCPICSQMMPAGRVKSCLACSWDSSFEKRLGRLQAVTDSAQVQVSLSGFGAWFKRRRGAQYAALNLQRYLPFLEELHQRWAEIPSYAVLVEHFGAEGLRRIRSVIYWLQETGQLHVDPVIREQASERRRIAHSLKVLPEGPAHTALLGYQRLLEQRLELGQLQLRSMRIALSSAVRLLFSTDAGGQRLPAQKDLLHLLRKRPGLWASLYGFVGYLNRRHSLKLTSWVDPAWLTRAAHALKESRLLELYAEGGTGEMYERRWISIALSCFHGLGRIGVKAFQYIPSEHSGHPGLAVHLRGKEYWVPAAPIT